MNTSFAAVPALALLFSLAPVSRAQADGHTTKIVVLDTGIVIQVPSAWKQKKLRHGLSFVIPEKTGSAEVNLYSVDFRDSAEKWQTMQANVVVTSRQNLVSQTSLDVNSIPLLLTESTYSTKGVLKNALSGLYYAAMKHKLLFRIDSPSASYDQAKADWMAAFVTLTTTDGSTLTAEDPSRPLTAAEAAPKPTKVEGQVIIKADKPPVEKINGMKIHGETAARSVAIVIPKGWTAAAQSASNWTLKNEKEGLSLSMTLASTLDSTDGQTALLTVTGKDLDVFKTVTTREEKQGTNRAGAQFDWIMRAGMGAAGSVHSYEALVSSGQFYLVLSLTGPGKLTGSQSDLLRQMADQISVAEDAAPSANKQP